MRQICLVLLGLPLAAAAQDYGADLATLRDEYVMKSRAFDHAGRKEALELVASLEARADKLAPPEFLIGLARTTALADNGHDSWHPEEGAWLPEKRAPMRFAWFPDALVVARAGQEQHDLIGARVTALDGVPTDELFRRLRILSGGPENYRIWNLNLFLERAELLRALGIARSQDAYTLGVTLRDGRAVTRDVAMSPRAKVPAGAQPYRLLAGAPYGNEAELGWRGIVGAPNDPLYLQEPDRLFRYVDLPALGAAYVQFRAHYGTDEEPIEAFQKEAAAKLAASKPRNLILDLRFDGGGDISKSMDFFPALPAAVPGRIYVVVSRLTFSAGIVAAALVEMQAPERVTLVGEPVGDRVRFWSEGHDVCLPSSRYCLHLRDGLWDLVKGCSQEPGCYGDDYKARVEDLDPDVAAPLTAEAWLSGTDPAMDAIEGELRGD
jgi:hypothetical protein